MVAVASRCARRRPDLDAPIVIRVVEVICDGRGSWRGTRPWGVPHPGKARRVRSIDEDGRWLIPRDTAGKDAAATEPDSCDPEPSDTGIG